MMAALKNRRFLVFGGAALVCLLLLLVGFLISAKQTVSLFAERNALDQKRNELQNTVKGVDLNKLRQDNDALGTELSEIERSLPEAEYMPTLIRQIESTAALTGNDIIELRPGEIRRGKVASATGPEGAAGETATKGGDEKAGAGGGQEKQKAGEQKQGEAEADKGGQSYDEMDIEIRLDGSYTGAFDFIKALGKLGKIISVETAEIERAGPNEVRPDGRTAATIRLTAKAYILAPRTGFPGELSIKVY
jgi:Tfp pilus assembly protein PilO